MLFFSLKTNIFKTTSRSVIRSSLTSISHSFSGRNFWFFLKYVFFPNPPPLFPVLVNFVKPTYFAYSIIIGKVVLSALPARLPTDDTQALSVWTVKGATLFQPYRSRWQRPLKKKIVAHLKVAFRPCVSGDVHKK